MTQFHLVSNSPWPIMVSIMMVMMMTNSTQSTLGTVCNIKWTMLSIMMALLTTMIWWRDITRETNSGQHTVQTINTLQSSMMLFILSEIFFFFGFFWSFFWLALEVKISTGLTWPPKQILPFDPYGVPLLNSAILLTSGVTVTWAHKMMMQKNHKETMTALMLTIMLGLMFTYFQYYEYKNSFFSMEDSVYGATFFVMTGFHGVHVMVGTLMLMSASKRMKQGEMNYNHHTNTEFAIWYWHFVDIVWLMLYIWVYWWPY